MIHVYNGGDYDGIAGVICAVELARLLHEEGKNLECDFVVAAFMDEEGCRFGNRILWLQVYAGPDDGRRM